MEKFEKEVLITGAWDKRNSDPSKNYGIHGMDMRFYLKGELGVAQFVVFTPLHLPHVHDELLSDPSTSKITMRPMGADIGYHSPKPMYDGHEPYSCDMIEGGECYYDGSGLQAEDFMPEFLAGGSEAVWEMLEARYYEIFGDGNE